eukprot:EG_transcript_46897
MLILWHNSNHYQGRLKNVIHPFCIISFHDVPDLQERVDQLHESLALFGEILLRGGLGQPSVVQFRDGLKYADAICAAQHTQNVDMIKASSLAEVNDQVFPVQIAIEDV